jgi:hypothetical protein
MSTIIQAGNATSGAVVSSDTAGSLQIQTGSTPTTAITVDTSQNVGIGITPSAWSGFKALQVGGTTSIWSSTSGNGSSFYSNNIYYNGSNRIYTTTGYATEYIQDSSAGSHIWFTAPSGSAGGTVTTTERMRIDSSGYVCIGTTSMRGNCSLTLSQNSGTTQWAVGPANSSGATQFYIAATGSTGVYLSSTSATSWSSNSDERIKENLLPIENAVEKVTSLRAVTGNYIQDETKTSHAFLIAQDLLKVLPEAVDTTNSEKYGVAYTETIPLLVAAIKELNAKVTALETQLGAK